MSRVLLTWELGLNLGHLTRLLPIAQQLRDEGHTVLVASRDVQAAATVLGRYGIPFIQAPHLPKGIALPHRPSGYADILLSQGWSDRSALWGLTQAWLNVIEMFRPDAMILDYSPTVGLAARIAKVPTTLVGNGFELPPETDPLPCFPGFSWATPGKAAESERIAVANANGVLQDFRQSSIAALRDLVRDRVRMLATFPELDHYGARSEATYIGPLLGAIRAPRVDWPPGDGAKVFACVRPDTCNVNAILGALSKGAMRVVCVASGFDGGALDPFRSEWVRFSAKPVYLEPLLDADLCLTYGAEGTMLRFLLAGVPQAVVPWHVETFMAARRIEKAGLGARLANCSDEQLARSSLERMCRDTTLKKNVSDFATSASVACAGQAADQAVVNAIATAQIGASDFRKETSCDSSRV